ncbi:MAG: glycosyltransferase family 2 protein [Pyrinomonadaceae bacterium]
MTNSHTSEMRYGKELRSGSANVSIIIPAYNVAGFIVETLNSVFTQSCEDYEIILINDGSPDTDALEKVLDPFFSRLIYVKQKNGGAASARNAGIRMARGEWLAFLDGDDIWLPEYLARQLSLLSEKKGDLVYADALLFGEVCNSSRTFMQTSPSSGKVTVEALISGTCNIITSGTVVRREAVVAAGMFDESLPRIGMEDFDLWVRLVRAGITITYHRDALLKYRVRSNSLSGTNVQRAQRSVTALEIIKHKYDLSATESTALEGQLRWAQANVAVEKCKLNLARNDFRAARANIVEARAFDPRLKLKVLSALLGVSPRLVVKLFKTIRPNDFSFIVSGEHVAL